MSNYNPNQTLNNQNENVWDDTISCGVEPHEFIAVTSNTIGKDASTRVIEVTVMTLDGVDTPPIAETNSGAYVREDSETSVTANIIKDGTQVGSSTVNYPS